MLLVLVYCCCFGSLTSGLSAEACKQGASDDGLNNEMLSRIFIGYGKMSDHVIYLPNSCLMPRSAPAKEEWSMGGDGPSIIGPSVYMSPSFRDVRCPADKLNYDVLQQYANELVDNGLLPVQCEDGKKSRDIALGIILVATGYPTEAYSHYSKMAQEDISCPAVYYGRALAYAKSGLLLKENAMHALADYNTALKYIRTEDQALAILERRAEVYQAIGKLNEANQDYSRILQNKNADPNIYVHRGSVLFLLEEYTRANEDFLMSLKTMPDQPVSMHYQALCLYHMGRLHEAIKSFQAILELKPDYTEVIQSLGQAYQELGEFELAIHYFNKALSVSPADARSYHYKGHLEYSHGDPSDALKSFKTCSSLEPFNEACQFMKGVSLATAGQFYPAIKELTKVMLNHPIDPAKPSTEYKKVRYVREWCRYVHSNLDSSLIEMSAEANLSAQFLDHWINLHPFNLKNYTEQPGIQPHIKDILTPSWDKLSPKTQHLLCNAYRIGSLVQYIDGEGYLGNKRVTSAMGLAAIEVSQAVLDSLTSSNSQSERYGSTLSWREIFDISVKWKRLVDISKPTFWLDQLPASKPSTFVHHINMLRGDKYNLHFINYIRDVIDLMKKLALEFDKALSSSDYMNELDRANDYSSIMKTILKYGPEVNDPGFVLGTKVPSIKDRSRKHLDGFMVSLTSLYQHGNNYTILSIDVATKRARTLQYYAELDFLWGKFISQMRKIGYDDEPLQDSVIDSILSLAYYFYNLMPISDGSGVINHATTLGLLMASGKKVTGHPARGKIIEMDALLAKNPEGFVLDAKSWMKIEGHSKPSTSRIPDVAELLPTLRSCLEVLNIDWEPKCMKR